MLQLIFAKLEKTQIVKFNLLSLVLCYLSAELLISFVSHQDGLYIIWSMLHEKQNHMQNIAG